MGGAQRPERDLAQWGARRGLSGILPTVGGARRGGRMTNDHPLCKKLDSSTTNIWRCLQKAMRVRDLGEQRRAPERRRVE